MVIGVEFGSLRPPARRRFTDRKWKEYHAQGEDPIPGIIFNHFTDETGNGGIVAAQVTGPYPRLPWLGCYRVLTGARPYV